QECRPGGRVAPSPRSRRGYTVSSITTPPHRRYTVSTITASPWPPPPHNAATPLPPPRRRRSSTVVPTSRAPVHPIGWPSATAPPLGLTLSSETPSRSVAWIATPAKASLI